MTRLVLLVASILALLVLPSHCQLAFSPVQTDDYWDRYYRYYNPNPQNPYSTRWHYLHPGFFTGPRMFAVDPEFYESSEGLRYRALFLKCTERNPDGSCRKEVPYQPPPLEVDPSVGPRPRPYLLENSGVETDPRPRSQTSIPSEVIGDSLPKPRPSPRQDLFVENPVPIQMPAPSNRPVKLVQEFDPTPPPKYGSQESQFYENVRKAKVIESNSNGHYQERSALRVPESISSAERATNPEYYKEYKKWYQQYQEYLKNYPPSRAQSESASSNAHSPSTIHDSEATQQSNPSRRSTSNTDSDVYPDTRLVYSPYRSDRAEIPWFHPRPVPYYQARIPPSTEPRSLVPQRGVETHAAKGFNQTSTITTTIKPKI